MGSVPRAGGADLRWSDVDEVPDRRLRLGPWPRAAARGLALLVGLAIAVGVYALWHSRPRVIVEAPAVLAAGASLTGSHPVPSSAPPDQTATLPAGPAASAAGAPVEVVVHVAGLVAHPGLVRLAPGSRVADAIEAAGGVTRRRAADTVNLARVLVDGEQIVVADPDLVAPGTGAPTPSGPTVLDLNAATADALDALPGVGPVLAARIVAWRASNGPFRSVEELAEVSGIGEAVLAQVRALVRV